MNENSNHCLELNLKTGAFICNQCEIEILDVFFAGEEKIIF